MPELFTITETVDGDEELRSCRHVKNCETFSGGVSTSFLLHKKAMKINYCLKNLDVD